MPDTSQTDAQASERALSCLAAGYRGRGWRAIHVLRCDVLEVLGGEEGKSAREGSPPERKVRRPGKAEDRAPSSPPSAPGPRIISKGDVADLIFLRRSDRCGSLGVAMLDAAKEATNG